MSTPHALQPCRDSSLPLWPAPFWEKTFWKTRRANALKSYVNLTIPSCAWPWYSKAAQSSSASRIHRWQIAGLSGFSSVSLSLRLSLRLSLSLSVSLCVCVCVFVCVCVPLFLSVSPSLPFAFDMLCCYDRARAIFFPLCQQHASKNGPNRRRVPPLRRLRGTDGWC